MQDKRQSKQFQFRNEIRSQAIHTIFQQRRYGANNQSQMEWKQFLQGQSTSIPSICISKKQQLIIGEEEYINAIERIIPDNLTNLAFLNNYLRISTNSQQLPLSPLLERTLKGLKNFNSEQSESSSIMNLNKEEMFLQIWKNILKNKVRTEKRLLIQIANIFIKWWNNQTLPLNYAICSSFIEQLVPLNIQYSFLKPIISVLMFQDDSLQTFRLMKTILQYKQPFEVAWVLLHPDLLILLGKVNKHSIVEGSFVLFKIIEVKAKSIHTGSPQIKILSQIVQIYIEGLDKKKQQTALNLLYNCLCLEIDILEYWNTFPYQKVLQKTNFDNYLLLAQLYLNILFLGDADLQQKIILGQNARVMQVLRDSCKKLTQEHVQIMILMISILDGNVIRSQECRKEVISVFEKIREEMSFNQWRGFGQKMKLIEGYDVQS